MTYPTPFMTIELHDDESGINVSTCHIEIDGADHTDIFDVSNLEATCQVVTPFGAGPHVLSVSVSDYAGNHGTAASHFTVGTTAEPIQYLFSVGNNDWVFASPGDGTCREYLSRDDLGVLPFSDVVALSRVLPNGDLYFSLQGEGGIFQSQGDSSKRVYFDNTQLGLAEGDQIKGEHTALDGSAIFAVEGQPDLYESSGGFTNAFFMQNAQLGLSDTVQVSCLHIGYDGKAYFCRSDQPGIFASTGDGTNSVFLTAADLGVPGAAIDAFAILPETVPPEITITHPVDGAFLNTTTPNMTVSFQDTASGINPATFYAELNGADVTSAFTVTDTGASYQVTTDFPLGDHVITASISDHVGNTSSATSHFMIDTDTDGDGLSDGWEVLHFHGLWEDGSGDPDGDGLDNAGEYLNGTNPNEADTDGDGATDKQEVDAGTDPVVDAGDTDGDGLSDHHEIAIGTLPDNPDSDNDGMDDGWEVGFELNPLMDDSTGDLDDDLLSNVGEYHAQTDPSVQDTDADDMFDGYEVARNLDPLQNDSAKDPDGDGYLNGYEWKQNTDPHDPSDVPPPTIVVETTIQTAINAATYDYDIVKVPAGTYTHKR